MKIKTQKEIILKSFLVIIVSFEIPYFTVSGFQVRFMKIVDKSGYEAVPWVRYFTRNGEYSIRII